MPVLGSFVIPPEAPNVITAEKAGLELERPHYNWKGIVGKLGRSLL